jgi:WD40 repeat protein
VAERRYKAFISYSRLDKVFAKKLQRELERYVIPQALRDQHDRQSLKPVYRDEDETVPGPNLPARLRHALEQSEHLIVVCSPAAAQSAWVEQEIVDFTRLGRDDDIIAVVVAGEPNAAARGLPQSQEALPLALRHVMDGDGTIVDAAAPPAWVDHRPAITDHRLIFLHIVAALLRLDSVDELIVRDREVERRRRRVVQSIAAIMTALTVITAFLLFVSEQTRNRALIAQSLFLSRDSQRATAAGDARLGVLLALQALPDSLLSPSRPVTAEAVAALTQAMVALPEQKALRSGPSDGFASAMFLPGGAHVAAVARGVVYDWDPKSAGTPRILERRKLSYSDAGLRYSFTWSGGRLLTLAEVKKNEPVEGSVLDVLLSTKPDTEDVGLWDDATGRKLLVLKGHQASVLSAQFSADRSRIVTAGDDGTARIWDAATGAPLVVLSGHQDKRVSWAAFSPDGTKVVTASFDRTARIWDAATGTQLLVLKGQEDVLNFAAFSPDGTRVVTAGGQASYPNDGRVRIWDAQSGRALFALGDPKTTTKAAAFSPDGTLVAAANDSTAYLWDARVGEFLQAFHGPEYEVGSVMFSQDGKQLLTDGGATVRVWDIGVASLFRSEFVSSMAYSPDGKTLAAVGFDHIMVGDIASGRLKFSIAPDKDGVFEQVVFSPDGRHLLAHELTSTGVWDAADGRRIAKFGGFSIVSAAFSGDGRRVVTAYGNGVARIWDAADGRLLAALKGAAAKINAAAFLPDGKLVTAGEDKTVRLWDARTGAMVRILATADRPFLAIAVSPNGAQIAANDDHMDDEDPRPGRVLLLDAESGTMEGTLLGGYDAKTLQYSRDGTRILATNDGAVVWDTASPRPLAAIDSRAAALSPDGTQLAVANMDIQLKRFPPRCQMLIDAAKRRMTDGAFRLSDREADSEFLNRGTDGFIARAYAAIRSIFSWALPAAGNECT